MERVIVSIVALALSTSIWTWLITSIDHFEREPLKYMFYTFLWGAVPGLLISFISQWVLFGVVHGSLGTQTLMANLLNSALIAPASEELCKGVAILIIFWLFHREFDGWVDGIVYGAVAGLGFNFAEDLPGLLAAQNWTVWSTLFFNDFLNGGAHAFYTAFTGIGFGVARYLKDPSRKVLAVVSGLTAAIVFHGINNGSVVMINAFFHRDQSTSLFFDQVYLWNYWGLALLLGVLWFVADRVERFRLQTYLRDEVPEVIPTELYDHLCCQGSRALSHFTPDQRAEFMQTVAELAQKKFQLQTMGDETGNTREIEALRQMLQRQCARALLS